MKQIARSRAIASTVNLSAWTEKREGLGGDDGQSLMQILFNRLDGAYPERWRKGFPTEKSVENWSEVWAEAFVEDRITPLEVKVGLVNIRRHCAWPPSLQEFLAACRPTLDYEAAFHEALKEMRKRHDPQYSDTGRLMNPEKWSNPAIFWAAYRCWPDLNNSPYQYLQKRWKAALDAAIADDRAPAVPMVVAERQLAAPTVSLEQLRKSAGGHIKALVARFGGGASDKPELTPEQVEAERERQLKALKALESGGGNA